MGTAGWKCKPFIDYINEQIGTKAENTLLIVFGPSHLIKNLSLTVATRLEITQDVFVSCSTKSSSHFKKHGKVAKRFLNICLIEVASARLD